MVNEGEEENINGVWCDNNNHMIAHIIKNRFKKCNTDKKIQNPHMDELNAKIDKCLIRDATRTKRLDNLEKRVEEIAQSIQMILESQQFQANALLSLQREISSVHEDVQFARRESYDDEDEFHETSNYSNESSLGGGDQKEEYVDVEKEKEERLRLERQMAERQARETAREAERQREVEKKRKEEAEERERERLREIEREKERKRLEEERKRKEELRKKREAEKRAKTLEIMGSLFDDDDGKDNTKGNVVGSNLFGGSLSTKKGKGGLFDDDDDDDDGVATLLKKVTSSKNDEEASPIMAKKIEKTNSLFGDDDDDDEPKSLFD